MLTARKTPAAAMPLRIPKRLLEVTFGDLRSCGQGRRECLVLWVGPWAAPDVIEEVVHPKHSGHFGGIHLDDTWLTSFLIGLSERKFGVRAQVHTHPASAFHSATDDDYPIVRTTGFLSLVIPDFAHGPVGLERTFLTEVQADGTWREVNVSCSILVT